MSKLARELDKKVLSVSAHSGRRDPPARFTRWLLNLIPFRLVDEQGRCRCNDIRSISHMGRDLLVFR
jgi:hypothetical protein